MRKNVIDTKDDSENNSWTANMWQLTTKEMIQKKTTTTVYSNKYNYKEVIEHYKQIYGRAVYHGHESAAELFTYIKFIGNAPFGLFDARR